MKPLRIGLKVSGSGVRVEGSVRWLLELGVSGLS